MRNSTVVNFTRSYHIIHTFPAYIRCIHSFLIEAILIRSYVVGDLCLVVVWFDCKYRPIMKWTVSTYPSLHARSHYSYKTFLFTWNYDYSQTLLPGIDGIMENMRINWSCFSASIKIYQVKCPLHHGLLAGEVNLAMASTLRFYDRNVLYGFRDVRNCRMPNVICWAFLLLAQLA